MITGCVIGDSLRVGAVFEPQHLRIRRTTRLDVSSGAVSGQPRIWTVIDFETDDHDAHGLAEELVVCLAVEGGWYADFTADDGDLLATAAGIPSNTTTAVTALTHVGHPGPDEAPRTAPLRPP